MLVEKFKRNWANLRQYPLLAAKSRTTWIGALLVVIAAGPALERASWANPGSFGQAGVNGSALTDAKPDPLLAFSHRSPGARGSGATLQTKHRLAAMGNPAVVPQEQILSNIRYEPPGLVAPAINDVIPTDFSPIGPSGPGPVFPAIGPGPGVPYCCGGSGGGGGSGGTGGGGGTPTTPVTPAVPEPSTWAMLMIGMLLMGSGIRSAHRRAAQGQAGVTAMRPDGGDDAAAAKVD